MQLTLPLEPLGLFKCRGQIEEVKASSTMHRGEIWVNGTVEYGAS